MAPWCGVDVASALDPGGLHHFSLSRCKALLDDGCLGPVREVSVGVDVDDKGASRVVSSECASVLTHSLFSESSSGFSYVYLVACATRYTIHLAEWSGMGRSFLFDKVAYFLS